MRGRPPSRDNRFGGKRPPRPSAVTRWLMLVLALAVTRPAGGEGPAAPPRLFLALGDSVAAGIGAADPARGGYAALVEAGLTRLFGPAAFSVNLAVPGETTASLVAGEQLPEAVRTLQRAARGGVRQGTITLTIGANDLLQASPDPQARAAALRAVAANLRWVLVRLRTAMSDVQVKLIVTGYYDPTESTVSESGSDGWWLAQLDATLAREARRAEASWVDVAAVFRGREATLTRFPQDIHPTDAGHRAIALAIWRTLAPAAWVRPRSMVRRSHRAIRHRPIGLRSGRMGDGGAGFNLLSFRHRWEEKF